MDMGINTPGKHVHAFCIHDLRAVFRFGLAFKTDNLTVFNHHVSLELVCGGYHRSALYDKVHSVHLFPFIRAVASRKQLDQIAVGFRTAVAVKRPGIADFTNIVHVEIGYDNLVFIIAPL